MQLALGAVLGLLAAFLAARSGTLFFSLALLTVPALALAAALLPAERRLGAAIRQTVDAVFEHWAGSPLYPAVRETLLTSMRGAALTYAFDPRDPATDPHVAQWTSIARTLLR